MLVSDGLATKQVLFMAIVNAWW